MDAELLRFLMIPAACGLSALFGGLVGYMAGKKKMKAERDLHLKARVKAEEQVDEYKGKYLIYKGMAKK